MFELTIEDTFNSAHQLIGYGGPCEKLHGHTWKVAVTVAGKKLNKIGILVDFKILKSKLKEILKKLDHEFLNELPEFKKINPSAENIAKFIFDKLNGADPDSSGSGSTIKSVKVWESEKTSAAYYE